MKRPKFRKGVDTLGPPIRYLRIHAQQIRPPKCGARRFRWPTPMTPKELFRHVIVVTISAPCLIDCMSKTCGHDIKVVLTCPKGMQPNSIPCFGSFILCLDKVDLFGAKTQESGVFQDLLRHAAPDQAKDRTNQPPRTTRTKPVAALRFLRGRSSNARCGHI